MNTHTQMHRKALERDRKQITADLHGDEKEARNEQDLSKWILVLGFFKKDYIYLLLERGEGREKERERNIIDQEKHRLVASNTPPTGDLACNPGLCPDWESNHRPFSSQAGAQSTESHQAGQSFICSAVFFSFIKKLTYDLYNFKMNF